jgi:thiamine-phosphate pyrophosphorylase
VTTRGWVPADVCQAWLSAGVALIQLRAKDLPSGRFLELADELSSLCRGTDARLIVNDRADIAAMAGAAGVHVGQDDLTPADARACVGASAVVGLSTHGMAQLEAGAREPVSYLALGPICSTETKATGCEPLGLEAVQRARTITSTANLPLVAIGGITLENAPAVRAAGADSIAVISGLLQADDLEGLERLARRWIDHLT